MRRIVLRSALPVSTQSWLVEKTTDIVTGADPVARAEVVWDSSRVTKWFSRVVRVLGIMSGLGQRCMYCSGSESAQVEHYVPKSLRPDLTCEWGNYIWVCGICNGRKGPRFEAPSPFPPNVLPIDPVSENPWDHFFIDEYGNLTAKWDPVSNCENLRAKWTIELLGLDRQALQESRLSRLNALRSSIGDTMDLLAGGMITMDEVEERLLTWFEEPFQPDVCDYFLDGPGASDPQDIFMQIIAIVDAG